MTANEKVQTESLLQIKLISSQTLLSLWGDIAKQWSSGESDSISNQLHPVLQPVQLVRPAEPGLHGGAGEQVGQWEVAEGPRGEVESGQVRIESSQWRSILPILTAGRSAWSWQRWTARWGRSCSVRPAWILTPSLTWRVSRSLWPSLSGDRDGYIQESCIRKKYSKTVMHKTERDIFFISYYYFRYSLEGSSRLSLHSPWPLLWTHPPPSPVWGNTWSSTRSNGADSLQWFLDIPVKALHSARQALALAPSHQLIGWRFSTRLGQQPLSQWEEQSKC